MKRILFISEIVDSREVKKGTRDVVASGEATFDENRSELHMDLGSHVIITDVRGHETRVAEDWLPAGQSVREGVSMDEAPSLARELFHRWAGKVRGTIPAPIAV